MGRGAVGCRSLADRGKPRRRLGGRCGAGRQCRIYPHGCSGIGERNGRCHPAPGRVSDFVYSGGLHLRLIFPRDTATSDSIAEWVMRNLGWRAVKPYRAIGAIDDRGELVAGVVWNGYNAANVDMTARSEERRVGKEGKSRWSPAAEREE